MKTVTIGQALLELNGEKLITHCLFLFQQKLNGGQRNEFTR